MAQKQNKKINKILLILALLILLIGGLLYFKNSRSEYVNHSSKDLKISLSYPKGWFIDDRYYSILLTSYETNQNNNTQPFLNQIEIQMDEFSKCFPSVEEDLMNPACGERKAEGPDKIIDKVARKTPGGVFYKYVTETPNGQKNIYYLLENDDRILKISRDPDPSNYDKEFEEIINSIRFLN